VALDGINHHEETLASNLDVSFVHYMMIMDKKQQKLEVFATV